MSEAIHDPVAYTRLTDQILERILSSDSNDLQEVYVAVVTTGFYIYTSSKFNIAYKPWPIGIYVSYTPAYVWKFPYRASGSREISQINSSLAGVYLHIYTSCPWFI